MAAVSNLQHNLVQQLSELMDSVWRYEKFYMEDAKECEGCRALWQNLMQRHEEDIKALKDEITKHVQEGDW